MKPSGKEKTGPKFAALRAIQFSGERNEWTWLLGAGPDPSARRRGVRPPGRRVSRLADKQENQWKNETTRWALGKMSATPKEFKPSEAIFAAWADQGRELAEAGRFGELEGWEAGAVAMAGHEARWPLLLDVMEGVERWMVSQGGGMSDAAAWSFASWMIAREDRKPVLHAWAAQGDAWRWADLAMRASILAQRQAGIPEVIELRRLQEAEMAENGRAHEEDWRERGQFAAIAQKPDREHPCGESTPSDEARQAELGEFAASEAISPWDAEAVCGWLLAAEERRKRQQLAESAPPGPLSFAAARELERLDSDTEWARAIGRWASAPSPALILAAIAKKAAKEAQRRAWAGGVQGLENWRAWALKNNWPLPAGWAEGNSQKNHPWVRDAKSKRWVAHNISQSIMEENGAMSAAPAKEWPQLWAQTFRICNEHALNKRSRQGLGRVLLSTQWKGGSRGEASRGAVHNWIAHCGGEASWREWAKALSTVSGLAVRDHEPFSIDSKRWYYGFLMLWRQTQDRWGLSSPLLAKILEFPVVSQIQCMPSAWGGEYEWVLRARNARFSLADCAVAIGDELFVDWAEGQTNAPIRKNAEIRFAETLREAQPLALGHTGKEKTEWAAMSAWGSQRESAWVAQELQEEIRRASAVQARAMVLAASASVGDMSLGGKSADGASGSGSAGSLRPKGLGQEEDASPLGDAVAAIRANREGARSQFEAQNQEAESAESESGSNGDSRSAGRGAGGGFSGRLRRPERL